MDEAYYHFYGETVLDLIGRVPNLVVARTFSKAYGLAGLRLGALIAAEETMQWLRRVISPYSVNQLALLCLPAALEDQSYLDWYVAEVKAARAELAKCVSRLRVGALAERGEFYSDAHRLRARCVCEGDAHARHSDA